MEEDNLTLAQYCGVALDAYWLCNTLHTGMEMPSDTQTLLYP